MSLLEIPERALKAACDAYDAALDREFREHGTVVHEGQEHAEQEAVRAAAPIIVAAELRRLTDDWASVPRRGLEVVIWADAMRRLHARANELDPEGNTT